MKNSVWTFRLWRELACKGNKWKLKTESKLKEDLWLIRYVRTSDPSRPNCWTIFMESWLLGRNVSPYSLGKVHLFSSTSDSREGRKQTSPCIISPQDLIPTWQFQGFFLRGTDSHQNPWVTTTLLIHDRQRLASPLTAIAELRRTNPSTQIHINIRV